MRALVTGSVGFAGTHLCAHLAECGDDVVGVDRRDGDLAQPGTADALLATHHSDVVYHLAGASAVAESWSDPLTTWDANATATLRLLEAARAHGVRRVLVVSSADVYGTVDESELPLDERSPTRPTSPYAASKLGAEAVTEQAWLGHGLETVRVRAFNHIGPGQRPAFVASSIASAIARIEHDAQNAPARSTPGLDDAKAAEIAVGDLSARRDFTDVRDVVRAYRALMVDGDAGGLYCVSSGTDVAISDIAERLVAMAEVPVRLVTDPGRLRPVDIPVLRGDNTRLRAATGWRPEHDLASTLHDLLDDCRRRVRAEAATSHPRSTP